MPKPFRRYLEIDGYPLFIQAEWGGLLLEADPDRAGGAPEHVAELGGAISLVRHDARWVELDAGRGVYTQGFVIGPWDEDDPRAVRAAEAFEARTGRRLTTLWALGPDAESLLFVPHSTLMKILRFARELEMGRAPRLPPGSRELSIAEARDPTRLTLRLAGSLRRLLCGQLRLLVDPEDRGHGMAQAELVAGLRPWWEWRELVANAPDALQSLAAALEEELRGAEVAGGVDLAWHLGYGAIESPGATPGEACAASLAVFRGVLAAVDPRERFSPPALAAELRRGIAERLGWDGVDLVALERGVRRLGEELRLIELDDEDFDEELARIADMELGEYESLLERRSKTPYGRVCARCRELLATVAAGVRRADERSRRRMIEIVSGEPLVELQIDATVDLLACRLAKSAPDAMAALLEELLDYVVLAGRHALRGRYGDHLTGAWVVADEAGIPPRPFFVRAAELASDESADGLSPRALLAGFVPYDYSAWIAEAEADRSS